MNSIMRLSFTRLFYSYAKRSSVTSSYRWCSKLTPSALNVNTILKSGEYERLPPQSEEEVVNVIYIDRQKNEIPIRAKIGDNVMHLAHVHEIDLEGACDASLSCSTCHVYIDEDYLDFLNEANDEENDMLDLAIFQKENSRLGCQVKLTKEMEGMRISIPSATRNFYVDGFVPKPH